MSGSVDLGVLLFVTLFALYSPLAALSSYLPIVGRLPLPDRTRLAVGLFTYVLIFAMASIWVGEPLLEVLGISTAALSVTGGIALLYASIPMMRGLTDPALLGDRPAGAEAGADGADRGDDAAGESWRRVLFTPVTFPLTVGGTTFGILVGFTAQTDGAADQLAVTVAGVAYAAMTGITLWVAGHLDRRLSDRSRGTLERIAGILLTAIGVTLLASGGTQLVTDALNGSSAF
ncbi:MAG: MarC family protein [Acidimicrobiales bacterium]|nr:MarC family protein [Acidimicrobiales bacterium]